MFKEAPQHLGEMFFPRSRLHLDLSNDNHCVLFFTVMCSDAILVRKVFCNNGDNRLKYAQLKQQCCVEICFTTEAKLLSFVFFPELSLNGVEGPNSKVEAHSSFF